MSVFGQHGQKIVGAQINLYTDEPITLIDEKTIKEHVERVCRLCGVTPMKFLYKALGDEVRFIEFE